MVYVNLGVSSCNNLEPKMAYGVIRSSSLVVDGLCLAVQGAALGIFFGNPILGAAMGATMALTDRLFAPVINRLPGRCATIIGLPIGKNTVLAAVSIIAIMALNNAGLYFSLGFC